MRSISSENYAALQARKLVARDFLWIVVRDRETGDPVTDGMWSDVGNIEAEVTYGDAELHVRIRDDGRGISATERDAGGMPGHFGLIGMRERTKKLGAHLEVWSKPGAGTEVDLRVPADVAYRRSTTALRGARSWLARFGSSAEQH